MLMLIMMAMSIMLWIIWSSFDRGYSMTAKYTPLVDAAMEIKLEVSMGHLWLEELIEGNEHLSYAEDVKPHFDQALWYTQAMLSGGRNSEGTFIALNDSEQRMRQLVKETESLLVSIEQEAQARLQLAHEKGLGLNHYVNSPAHQAFNDDFESLISKIDSVESELQLIIERDLKQYLFYRNLLMVLVLLLSVIAAYTYRYIQGKERELLMGLLKIEKENLALTKKLELTLKKAPEAVCWLTREGGFSYVNDEFCKVTGYSRDELLVMSVNDIYVESAQNLFTDSWDVVKQRKRLQYESQFKTQQGKIIDVEVVAAYASDNNQEIKISYLRDMTDRNRLMNELEALNHGLAKSQELIDRHIPIATSDLDGHITDCNLAYSRLTGFDREELLGHSFGEYGHADTPSKLHKELWATILNNRTWEGELKNVRKDGSEYWVRTIINPFFDENGTKIGYKTVREEITDKKTLEILATTDILTGVCNRAKFDELVHYELIKYKRHKLPNSLLLCDIDFFKQVNDVHGHLIGDEVLKRVAQILTDMLRESDVVARWGGEEFVLLLPDTQPQEAYNVAEKVRKAIEAYAFEEAGDITVSIGVTGLLDADDASSWFKRTDKALYQSKNSGRNQTTLI